jgi:3' terminal RNA ribose 2'-O-methyltransferase Hen1
MLLTITTTHQPATDLGFLLHKNPASLHSKSLPFGQAHVFYPVATAERCTAALLLDVDPIGLIRGPSAASSGVDDYVNDRPYVASSFMSVAIARLFGTAMGGRSKERRELADTPISLEARLACVPCSGGEEVARSLFEPLGYAIGLEPHVLDPAFPDWGASRYFSLSLRATCRLADLLSHLYVLVPVLDDGKHYWVDRDEIEKLLRRGEGWLGGHPARDLIVSRYLRHQRGLTQDALRRLVADEGIDNDEEQADAAEQETEAPLRLNELRLATVLASLKSSSAARVLDLGCGEGRLLRMLLAEPQFSEIVGLDVSSRVLEIAARRLHLEQMPDRQRERIRLMHGSLVYRDARLAGFDAAAVVEVIEHLDPWRLEAFERVLFEFARPSLIVVTTPNGEFNVRFASLAAGRFRHADHRFEWTRSEFRAWCDRLAERYGYRATRGGIGPDDDEVGAPTQIAVFER